MVMFAAGRIGPSTPGAAAAAGASREARGAPAVAERALAFAWLARFARPALVNGAAGVVVARVDGCSRS
jgi:hypothetical protein